MPTVTKRKSKAPSTQLALKWKKIRNDNCGTPAWLYKALDTEFKFDLDPCPLAAKPKVDGLALDWNGRRVFCNPPYSNIVAWVKKGLASACLTVFLVPKRYDAEWARRLRDANAEFRHYEKKIVFDRLGGGDVQVFGGNMIAIVRRLDRL